VARRRRRARAAAWADRGARGLRRRVDLPPVRH